MRKKTPSKLPALFWGQRRKQFIYLVFNGSLQAALAVMSALLIRAGFDQWILQSEVTINSWLLVLGLSGSLLCTAALRWRSYVDAEILGQSYVHAVRMKLFRHVLRLGSEGMQQMGRGSIMLRFIGDLSALRQWVSLGIARLLVSGLAAGLSIVGLALLDPLIALSVLLAVSIAVFCVWLMGAPLRSVTRELRRQRGLLATPLNDRLSKLSVITAFAQDKREQQRFKRASRRVKQASVARVRIAGLLRAMTELGAGLASLCALLVGTLLIEMAYTTPGAVVAAMMLAGLLTPRLQELGRVYEYWNGACVARQKQQQLLSIKPNNQWPKKQTADDLPEGFGHLQLDHVGKKGRLMPLSVTLAAGQRVLISGMNGAGKSTLMHIIAGLLTPSSGKVILDGMDIRQCDWKQLRQSFALVSPELPLLRGSIHYNLTYGATSTVSEKQLKQVIKACDLTDVIKRLDKGILTRVNESGDGLSAGERERIALARALLVKPRVLLLDEAEAHFDPSAIRALQRLISNFAGTVIMISHRAADTSWADQLIQLRTDQPAVITQLNEQGNEHKDAVACDMKSKASLAQQAPILAAVSV